jgi:hypothetical protein
MIVEKDSLQYSFSSPVLRVSGCQTMLGLPYAGKHGSIEGLMGVKVASTSDAVFKCEDHVLPTRSQQAGRCVQNV